MYRSLYLVRFGYLKSTMAPKVERIQEGCILGEGPHWDVASQTLYFVDIPGKDILTYNPATNKTTKASVAPKQASFIIPVEGKKNQFIVSLDEELAIISWDGESDKVSIVEKLVGPDDIPKIPNNKFNDAKCDSSGRLWAGNHGLNADDLNKSEPVGTLWSLDAKRQLRSHVSKIRIANGLAFNDQTKKMYYIDSLKFTVDQFDFDVTNGTLANRQVWFSFKKHNIDGFPDGMAIDTDGNLWVAGFNASKVLKVDGTKPETLLDSVDIPALQVTSVAFGGKNLDELYVTTARLELEGLKLPLPANGATYRITGTGAKGLPGVNYKIN